MRTIKFRGTSINGHTVYGLLSQKVIRNSGEISWSIATGLKQSANIPVCEGSVAQLISVDKNGEEVYEGDEITDGLVNMKATFADYAALVGGEFVHA